ncbi:MAG: hypothetical protein KF842_00325 [Caulobacter sp.]|nr:hypothetical protein [Caulobacter sp.]
MTSLANLHQALQRLIKPLMVICILLLAVGPVADSIMCGLETGEIGTAELVADLGGDDDRDSTTTEHAICAHGHCHHPAPLAGAPEVQQSASLYTQADRTLLFPLEPPSIRPPSLKRPPRV